MTDKGPPALNLDPVQVRKAPAHPVAKVPLGPAPLVGVLLGVRQNRILLRLMASLVRNPPVFLPFPKREATVRFETIHARIGLPRSQLVQQNGSQEPLFWEFQNTVVEIGPLKDAEGQHLGRRDKGFKGQVGPRVDGEGVGVGLRHAVKDVDDCACLEAGRRVPLGSENGEHCGNRRGLFYTGVLEMHPYW